MNAKRISALVAAALVMGLVAGNVASSFAATTATTTGSGAALRLGATMRDSGGRLLDVVAKLTGTSTEAVVTERQAGKTYTQIAAAKGISSAAVVDEALKVRDRRSERQGQGRQHHAGPGRRGCSQHEDAAHHARRLGQHRV